VHYQMRHVAVLRWHDVTFECPCAAPARAAALPALAADPGEEGDGVAAVPRAQQRHRGVMHAQRGAQSDRQLPMQTDRRSPLDSSGTDLLGHGVFRHRHGRAKRIEVQIAVEEI
jgi:hypothetical protein